jgi:hypothetical protein
MPRKQQNYYTSDQGHIFEQLMRTQSQRSEIEVPADAHNCHEHAEHPISESGEHGVETRTGSAE